MKHIRQKLIWENSADLGPTLKPHSIFAAFSVDGSEKENLQFSIKVSLGKYHCKTFYVLCYRIIES